jgi:hypothetical protein
MSQGGTFLEVVAKGESGAPGHTTSELDLAGHCSMLLGKMWGCTAVRHRK